MLFKSKRGIQTQDRNRYDRVPKLMWIKCESCGKLVYYRDYKDNHYVCPRCGHVFIMSPKQRFNLLFDAPDWVRLDLPQCTDDPLEFADREDYTDRLVDARAETGEMDAVAAADGKIGGIDSTICVLNGFFMMGSMGRAVGDGIIAAMEHAVQQKRPFVMVTSSGGARMQENILALMQMARTTVVVNKLHENKIPYIVILTDPTFGGVTASFAMLGDIHIAEAGARIGFAGRRVIEQNIREKLPSNFQTAEYLYEHGMVDIVSARCDLHDNVARVLRVLTHQVVEPKVIKVQTPKMDKDKKIRGLGESEAYDKVLLARHENRPHFLDYVAGIVDDWTYLAGDRCFGEDAAMGSGIGFWRGVPAVIIGQESGRTIETRQKHRFGMANPEGYRKAVRMMRLAERFGLAIVSLFDTAGANAGRESEERGQSQAVANSIATGLEVKAPYVAVNVGQGGSGGAIAIGTGDKILMMENAIYSVIAPESCASILWRDNKFKAVAATSMKLTARDMANLNVIDGIIAEPAGGAHNDWQTTMELVAAAVTDALASLREIPVDELPKKRGEKFIAMTRDVEIYQPEPVTE
jgi:acetyl-CoA carboxylase carboxyl transferase subunit beta